MVLPPNTFVVLSGLDREKYNGRKGVILNQSASQANRVQVKLRNESGEQEVVLVRPPHLYPAIRPQNTPYLKKTNMIVIFLTTLITSKPYSIIPKLDLYKEFNFFDQIHLERSYNTDLIINFMYALAINGLSLRCISNLESGNCNKVALEVAYLTGIAQSGLEELNLLNLSALLILGLSFYPLAIQYVAFQALDSEGVQLRPYFSSMHSNTYHLSLLMAILGNATNDFYKMALVSDFNKQINLYAGFLGYVSVFVLDKILSTVSSSNEINLT